MSPYRKDRTKQYCLLLTYRDWSVLMVPATSFVSWISPLNVCHYRTFERSLLVQSAPRFVLHSHRFPHETYTLVDFVVGLTSRY